MSFVKKELTKEEAQALVDKYHIASPWPSDDIADTNNLSICVYDPDESALFGIIEAGSNLAYNGVCTFDGNNGVSFLIWKGSVVRIDFYEDVIGTRKMTHIVATKIIAPTALRDYKDRIIELLEIAVPECNTAWLPSRNMDNKYTFKPTDITFTDREDIWNL